MARARRSTSKPADEGKRVRVELPRKLSFLFKSRRYKVMHGGRGAAKSWSVARALLVLAARQRMRILCCREFQVSIKDSVHKLLSDQIDGMGYRGLYEVQRTSIFSACGSEFIFSGIKTNIDNVRSMEGIDICWVEEGETVSQNSWDVLIPTIRKDGSEIWVTFNPRYASDPTYKRFITSPPPDAAVVEINWYDNPWFPEVLRREKDYAYSVDAEAAAHVWEGKTKTLSKAQILADKYVVEPFEVQSNWNGPYYGVDWGFSSDPTVMVKCWVRGGLDDLERELYVEEEAYRVGVENDELPAFFDDVTGSRAHVARADSSRPETINHCNNHGYPLMEAVEKWAGSVEDGIRHLRGYRRIVVHPSCKHTADEMRLYSYKTDPLTGDVLPVIIDKNNHCIDGIRYALCPLIRYQVEHAMSPAVEGMEMNGERELGPHEDMIGPVSS